MNSLVFTLLLAVAWPGTPASSLAQKYLKAFNKDEAAMRQFFKDELTEESLKKRSMEERISNYRMARAHWGTLTATEVLSSKPEEIRVKIASESGGEHQFTFAVQPDPPHKLLSIRSQSHE
jgi:hypothetical protein